MEAIVETVEAALARVEDITARIAGAPPSERPTLRELAHDADRALSRARANEAKAEHERRVERRAELDRIYPEVEARRLQLQERERALFHEVQIRIDGKNVVRARDAAGIRELSTYLAQWADALAELQPVAAEATALDFERLALRRELQEA